MSFEVARILVSQAAQGLTFPFPVGWAGHASSQPESQAVKAWGVWSIQHGNSNPAIIGAGSIGVGSHVRSRGLLTLQMFVREQSGTALFAQAADIAKALDFKQTVRARHGYRTVVTLRSFSFAGVSFRQGYRQENLTCEFTRDNYYLGPWGQFFMNGLPLTINGLPITYDSAMPHEDLPAPVVPPVPQPSPVHFVTPDGGDILTPDGGLILAP